MLGDRDGGPTILPTIPPINLLHLNSTGMRFQDGFRDGNRALIKSVPRLHGLFPKVTVYLMVIDPQWSLCLPLGIPLPLGNRLYSFRLPISYSYQVSYLLSLGYLGETVLSLSWYLVCSMVSYLPQ